MARPEYVFHHIEDERELERLRTIERVFDPSSRRRLGRAGFFLRTWHTSELGAVNRVNQAIKVMYDELGMDYALGLTLPAQLQRHGVMG